MKRIYMTLALLGGLVFGAKAQTVDVLGVIAFPAEGDEICKGATLDTNSVRCFIGYRGPDDLIETDAITFMSSFSRPVPATPGNFYVDGVIFGSGLIYPADTGLVFVMPNDNEIGMGHTAPWKLSADSIHFLVDWDSFQNNSIVAVMPPFVDGKSYGFYWRAIAAEDENNTEFGDPVPANNVDIQRIVWCTNGVGIKDMFAKKDRMEIEVYPNPAKDMVSFNYNAATATHGKTIVRDLAGRIVAVDNYGRILPGEQKYSLDISKLSNGVYTLEFSTDEKSGITKFSVQK